MTTNNSREVLTSFMLALTDAQQAIIEAGKNVTADLVAETEAYTLAVLSSHIAYISRVILKVEKDNPGLFELPGPGESAAPGN